VNGSVITPPDIWIMPNPSYALARWEPASKNIKYRVRAIAKRIIGR
jgi:hypothetical protein